MQEPDEDFTVLSRRYGTSRARRIWQLSREATRELVHGGNGMTSGFLAARLLLDWYRGERTADHALFAFSR